MILSTFTRQAHLKRSFIDLEYSLECMKVLGETNSVVLLVIRHNARTKHKDAHVIVKFVNARDFKAVFVVTGGKRKRKRKRERETPS